MGVSKEIARHVYARSVSATPSQAAPLAVFVGR